jgi:hypothetical protein
MELGVKDEKAGNYSMMMLMMILRLSFRASPEYYSTQPSSLRHRAQAASVVTSVVILLV